TSGLERIERCLDWPIVMKSTGELVLVEAHDLWTIDRHEQPQPDCRGHLAVGQVMHDLARRPLPRCGMRVELLVGGTHERFRHGAIAVLVLIDELLAKVGSDNQPRVLAIPGAAASCSVRGSRCFSMRC